MNELFKKLNQPFNGAWAAVESNMAVFEYTMIRLPVRSILRFKSISKFWYNVLSTKNFAILHRNWSKKTPKFFVFYSGDLIVPEMHQMEPNGTYSESYTIPIFETLHNPQLIASFNGLTCCMNDVAPSEMTYDMDLYICNPATREVLLLPKSHLSYDKPIFGFLYSEKYHCYKILKFFTYLMEPENGSYSQCEVYSSKTGTWKLLANYPFDTILWMNRRRSSVSNHVCINEKLYWFISDDNDGDIDFPTSILTMDMEDNFREIELPAVSDIGFLIEFRDRLCFVDWRGLELCLWLYDDNNDGWSSLGILKFQVSWLEDAHFDSVVARDDEILFICKDAEGLRHEFLYDVGHADWKIFRIAEDDQDKAIVVFPFFETLLPCNSHTL